MIALRIATIEDIPLIFQLAKSIWMEHYVPIIGLEQVNFMLDQMYNEDSLKHQMNTLQHSFKIVIDHQTPIGFVSISGEKDLFIHKFYIIQLQQSKGVGSQVFRELLKLYQPIQSIRLTVNRQNYTAINFYFKNGFIIEEVKDFDIGNGFFMNDFIMQWRNS